jgi:hypothetical protein
MIPSSNNAKSSGFQLSITLHPAKFTSVGIEHRELRVLGKCKAFLKASSYKDGSFLFPVEQVPSCGCIFRLGARLISPIWMVSAHIYASAAPNDFFQNAKELGLRCNRDPPSL